jgi:hypothetical protein
MNQTIHRHQEGRLAAAFVWPNAIAAAQVCGGSVALRVQDMVPSVTS